MVWESAGLSWKAGRAVMGWTQAALLGEGQTGQKAPLQEATSWGRS